MMDGCYPAPRALWVLPGTGGTTEILLGRWFTLMIDIVSRPSTTGVDNAKCGFDS